MRPLLAAVLVAAAAAPAAAADTPDPLRYLPPSSPLVVKVEGPRKLAEAVVALEAFETARGIPQARGVLDSAQVRRALQVLAFFERELGAKWPELLDQLAGGGVALGATLDDNAPALVVIQGTDEKQTAKAFDLVLRVLDEELTREGAAGAVVRGKPKGGVETARIGDGLHLARVGGTILASNKADMVTAAIARGKSTRPADSALGNKQVAAARKLLPQNPLAWACVDLTGLMSSQSAKDFFDATRQDFLQTLVVGSSIDCVRRSDFVAAGVYKEPTGFRLAVRLPAGRSEFPPEFALHVPPKGEPGSLPLLEPKGVVYSQSFYLDLGYLWTNRSKLLNDETRKGIEEAEEQLSKVIPGSVKIRDILAGWSPYHRIVVVNQDELPYKTQPGQRLPGFAYVSHVKDKKFATGLESILRSGGLVVSLQYGLKLKTETVDGVTVTGWRFPENKPLDLDPDGFRFNYEPCFFVADDEFVFASSFEVARKLVPEIRRTAKLPASPAVWRGQLYGAGGADLLTTVGDPLVTETILGEGVGLDEARKQVKELAGYVRGLGTLRVEIDERDTAYHLDVVWEVKK